MKNNIPEMSQFAQKVLAGMELVATKLLEEKKRAGTKLVIMLDDKVVELTADEYLDLKASGRL